MESLGNLLGDKVNKNTAIRGKIFGFTQIPNPWLFNPDFTVYEKCTLFVMLGHQMNKEKSWASHETMAHECNCSVSSIKKAVKGLEAKGLVNKSHEAGKKSNVYYVKKHVGIRKLTP